MTPAWIRDGIRDVITVAPYLATHVLTWEVIVVPTLPTVAVDPWHRLYCPPQRPADISAAWVVFVLLHEVCHELGRHPEDLKTWKIQGDGHNGTLATECAANVMAQSWNGVTVPPSTVGIWPADHELPARGTARQYFEMLQRRAEKAQGQDKGGDKGEKAQEQNKGEDKGESEGEDKGNGEDKGESEDGDKGEDKGGDKGEGEPQRKKPCSTCAPGNHPWELPPPEDALIRALNREAREERLAQRIASTPGLYGTPVNTWAGTRVHPVSPEWPRILRGVIARILRVAGGQDPTYSRPYRRGSGVPSAAILPGRDHARPVIRVLLDTSASMDAETLNTVLAVVIDTAYRYADTCVWGGTIRLTTTRPIKNPRGNVARSLMEFGGGTNMMECLRELATIPGRCDAVIVVTDGETKWSETPLHRPLVVALTAPTSYPTPLYAQVVTLGGS